MFVMGYTVKETAEILGIDPRTVRRRIKNGTIKADIFVGKYGPEWIIDDTSVKPPDDTPDDTPDTPDTNLMQMISELQRENRDLAARLGYLEAQLEHARKQLTAGNTNKWWVFWRRDSQNREKSPT